MAKELLAEKVKMGFLVSKAHKLILAVGVFLLISYPCHSEEPPEEVLSKQIYKEVKEHGFYSQMSCGFTINKNDLTKISTPLPMDPVFTSMNPYIQRFKNAESCSIQPQNLTNLTQNIKALYYKSMDVKESQKNIIKTLIRAQQFQKENLKDQALLTDFMVDCFQNKIPSSECKEIKAEVVSELQGRNHLQRIFLATMNNSPDQLSVPSPLIAKMIPEYWNSTKRQTPLSEEEMSLLKGELKLSNEQHEWFLQKLRETSPEKKSEMATEAYYYVMSKSPILSSFSKAAISEEDIANAFIKKQQALKSAKAIEDNYTGELLVDTASIHQSLQEAKEKLSKEDFYNLCLDVDRQLLHYLEIQKDAMPLAMLALSAWSFGTTATAIGSLSSTTGKEVLKKLGTWIGAASKKSIMPATVLSGSKAFQDLSKAEELNQICQAVSTEKDLMTKSWPLCRGNIVDEKLKSMQLYLIITSSMGVATKMTPTAWKILKGTY